MINRKFINRTGYTKGTTTSNNPVNIIPSQDITMKNVPYPIQATPLDKYGNPIGQSTMMMPEEDYFFENAAYVEEHPIMQMGGSLQPLPQAPSLNTYNPENFLEIQKKAEEDMKRRMEGMAPQPQIKNNGKPLYQFANPYGGQDFSTSLFNLGTSISEGNTEGIVSSGANVLFKGAKTFLSGLGSGNREQYNMQQFYDKSREGMTGNYQYMQQGGQAGQEELMMQIAEALQQGATPEQILEQLISSGISQEEAIQIVEAVVQQMQGLQPQEQIMQMGGVISPQLTSYGAFNQTTAFGTTGRKQMTPQELEYVTKKTGLKGNQFSDNLPVVEKYLNQFRTGTEPIGAPQADKNNAFTLSENGRINAGVYNNKTDTFNFAQYQEGGQQDITAQIAQALSEGEDPQQILTQLVESGMDEVQATELIQGVLGQMQNNEQPQFEKGGMYKKDAAVNAGVVEEEVPKNIANSEIEKNEYIFDSKGIRKAVGDTHEKGGIQTKLEDGAKVLSDHLKVGDAAEKLSEKLGKKIKPTLTYAKVLDVYNKESGIDEINNEIIKLTEQLEKSQSIKDEATSDINTEFLIGKIATQTDKKKPLEKEQQTMFQVLFDIQEQSKSATSSNDKFQDGGTKVLQEISEKYNIPLENLMKAVPQYQAGGNVSVNNTQSVFTNQPSATDWLPYTPVENATNPLWVGQAYDTQWIPLVEKSLADPKQAKQIEDWLLSNKQYGENIAYQLNGLEGQARINRIKQLATDKKPGTFHNAFLEAVQETVKPIQLNEVVINGTKPANTIAPLNGKNSGQETIMSTLDMPNRPVNMPTWNPSLKVSTRLNRIDPALISPEQQLAETDRVIQSAQQDLSNLSPAQRAVANIGILAQQISGNNKVIVGTNRFNAQATNQANIYNAKISDVEQQAENQNALNYEARTLQGLSNYERDMQNMQAQQFRDQTEKWKYVQIMNQNNALSPDTQWDGNQFRVYTPTLSDLNLNFVNTPTTETKKKTIPKKKIGGRFKK